MPATALCLHLSTAIPPRGQLKPTRRAATSFFFLCCCNWAEGCEIAKASCCHGQNQPSFGGLYSSPFGAATGRKCEPVPNSLMRATAIASFGSPAKTDLTSGDAQMGAPPRAAWNGWAARQSTQSTKKDPTIESENPDARNRTNDPFQKPQTEG